MTALDGWENFYVIVGSSAGALIGLQFVVVTLIADRPALRTAEAGAAFGDLWRLISLCLAHVGIYPAKASV
ncbi:MAG: hypothetical protein C4291_03175 [Candidatus Dadabacteria bacterium]